MLEKIYHKNLIKNLYHQKITENNTKNTYSRMTEIAKIEKILELIFSDTGKGYCEWEKKTHISGRGKPENYLFNKTPK